MDSPMDRPGQADPDASSEDRNDIPEGRAALSTKLVALHRPESPEAESLAALRNLSPGSRHWPAAHAISRAAMRGGVDRRVAIHSAHVRGIAFSPDGAHVASGSSETIVYNLATRTSRTARRAQRR